MYNINSDLRAFIKKSSVSKCLITSLGFQLLILFLLPLLFLDENKFLVENTCSVHTLILLFWKNNVHREFIPLRHLVCLILNISIRKLPSCFVI
jgi:hypothetical protein